MTGPTMRRLLTALAAALFMAALPSSSSAAAIRRVSHTSTLLATGDLLIAGGVNQTGNTLNSADIISTSRGPAIIAINAMGTVRSSHTATLMPNGCVLVAGGNTAATDAAAVVPTATTEIYNPATGNWTAGSAMNVARFNHTSTLLNDGRVLLCGGQNNGTDVAGNALASCELYTPTSCTAGTFAGAPPSMAQARYNHTAVLLKSGLVWFAGGRNPLISATGGYLSTSERFNPTTNTFLSAAPLTEARSHHTATVMGDGKVLVVGGYNKRDVIANAGVTESAEIYDPISNSITPAASMTARRHAHSAVLSADGSVDVYGGLGNITTTFMDASRLLDANSNITFSPISAPTASITGGTGNIGLNFLLSKPVVGVIQNGEMWMSTPTIVTTWGSISFTPASELVSATGLRINLAGQAVDCALPFTPDSVLNNCGSIKTAPGTSAKLIQMSGQTVFNRRIGLTPVNTATVNSGTINLPGALDSANLTRTFLAASGSSLNADITITMDKAFIGKTIDSGYLNIADGSIVQLSSFTIALSSGGGNIPPSVVFGDAAGNGRASFNITFNNLEGIASYTGQAPQSFGPSFAIPLAGTVEPLALTMSQTYTTDGADISGETFHVDITTVVIRKMVLADHETYNPKTNSWSIVPLTGFVDVNQRYGHSATLLPNNDTLYYGGRACTGATCATQVASATPEIQLVFAEKNFAAGAGSAAQARAFHTSTLLPNGDILVAGGTNGPNVLSSAETFSPTTEFFSPIVGSMRYVRDLHTATLLPNGRVLIAGGFTTNAASTGSTNTSEIYYPDTRIFLETDPMISSRSNHTALLLPNGNVFAAGGFGTNSALQNDVASDTAEIYVSTKSRWEAAPNMPAGCERALHATVQLKDGRIMLIGGVNGSGVLATSAIYNPTTNSWGANCTTVTAMPTALRSHTATLLFDGRVLVTGGNDGLGEANVSYIYDSGANTWTATDPVPLSQARFSHTATLLPNGNVMITGGSQRFGSVPALIETYHVSASSWVVGAIPVKFATPRAFHTMTLGLNNKLFAIGGSDGIVGSNGVSLYSTVERGYFTATPDNFTKNAPPSFRQSAITTTSASPFLPGTNLTVNGSQFRGGTEASGGGAASANSAFSYPHMLLQQVDGSGGGASQSNGGFVVDLTTEIFVNAGNLATLDTSLTVALPATNNALPYGWYSLRTGANDLYSDGKLVQVGPAKPVAAPTGMTGTALGVSSMTWSWNVVGGAIDGYNVYNATTGVFLSSIPATVTPTYIQTGLDPGATAAIIVGAYTLTGDGPLTNSPTSYTLSTTPVNVTIASVTFSDLLLFWGTNNNSFPGTVYEVTESSDNFVNDVSTPVPQLFHLTDPFTTINNLSPNTTYFFRIRAINPIGLFSPYSVVVSTRTRTPVTQPNATAGGLTTTSILWNWADPGGVTNFRVYNATTGVLLAAPTVNSFNQVGLGTNTFHSIFVSAVTNAGEGPLSPSATAFSAAASPGLFVPVANPTTGSITINWTNNGNPLLTQYRVKLTEFDSAGATVGFFLSTTTGFNQGFPGLKPSTFYGHEIVAVNGDGVDSAAVANVFGSTWTKPTPPINTRILGTTPTSITVAWDSNNNSSSATYEVTFTSNNFINTSTAVAFSARFGGTSVTIPGLITSTSYTIQVRAANPFGQASQFDVPATTTTFNGGAAAGSLQGPLSAAGDSSIVGSLGNGRNINLRAAAHTFPSDVIVTISSFVPTGPLCPGATVIAFSIVATPALQPTGSLYFSFDFAPAELGTIPASRALLLRYEPVSRTCVPLETTLDTVNGVMTARINHFSLFQVGQVPLAATAETARVFPNPYYTSRDGFLTIDNIPPFARVRIYTMRGEQVLDVKANASGLLTWSGTNGFGRAVASGVYLVMVESGGTKKILKLAVIR